MTGLLAKRRVRWQWSVFFEWSDFLEKIYRKHEKKLAALQQKLAKKEKPCYKEKNSLARKLTKISVKEFLDCKKKNQLISVKTPYTFCRKNSQKSTYWLAWKTWIYRFVTNFGRQKIFWTMDLGCFEILQYKLKDFGRIFWKSINFIQVRNFAIFADFQNPATKDLNLREFECPACHKIWILGWKCRPKHSRFYHRNFFVCVK